MRVNSQVVSALPGFRRHKDESDGDETDLYHFTKLELLTLQRPADKNDRVSSHAYTAYESRDNGKGKWCFRCCMQLQY
jgi:hypothetical protein